jgi:DNA-binding XRE family transcriptional regulator
MILKKPAALMSYAHSDNTYGHLTTFREHLSVEVQVQTGDEFQIFQDSKDIHWGQNWERRIENALLEEITFLIPIITPSFFKSKACRKELARFVELEKKLGRNDLILPVYYVNTPLLNDAELRATDELAQVIASRQYADWRQLRLEPFTNPQVGKTLAKLAVQIRDALLRIQKNRKASAKMGRPYRSRPKRLGEKLRFIRIDLGLTQSALISELRVKGEALYPSSISLFEQGAREPSLPVLLAYSKLAGVTIDALVDDIVP